MTSRCFSLTVLVSLASTLVGVRPLDAQYFGRNKVQYEKFDWRILKSDHFDLYFYPAESLKVHDAGRQSERWYSRLSDIFRHQFDRKSLVFYADHPDFQQTNVIGGTLSEGTGGVTEGLRTRVVMPWTGVYDDDEHVLGHELVHVFQYNVAESAPGQGGLARLGALPLWLIEGMAEYFSLGRNDALTAMWMRDAVMRDKFPTIKQLTTDPRFFPYRYGQALWAYIGGRWGDRAVVDVYRTALRLGWDQALVRALGLSSDSLSKDWAAANKAFYASQLDGRTHPDSVGRTVVRMKERSEYNVGPVLSPGGRYMAFFTTKTNLFGIDLVLAEAATGRVVRRLAGPQSDGHFDAISFLNSSGTFSPDGDRFAFIVYNDGNNEIVITNTASGDIQKQLLPANIGAIYNVAWSPSGREIVFSGSKGGISDLYMVDVQSGAVRQLTNDRFGDLHPAFSPDGRTIAFATDRAPLTNFTQLTFGELQIATLDIASGQVTVHSAFGHGKHINPQFSPDGENIFFVSDQDGVSDVYRMNLASKEIFRITRVKTGISGVTAISPTMTVAERDGTMMFTVFKDQGHEIVALRREQLIGTPVNPASAATAASASTLPPGDVAGNMTVAAYLGDPNTGLVSGSEFRSVPYRSSFQLDALGQPSLGVQTGGFYGAGVVGGISALFGDQLGDRMIYTVVQANGSVKDFGGAVYYQNLKRRWNWLAGASHVAYLSGGFFQDQNQLDPQFTNLYRILQRVYIDQLSASTQYPFSATRRFELGISGTRQAFEIEIDSVVVDPFGNAVLRGRSTGSGGFPQLYYAQGSAAFVGDNSFGAYTSPVSGMRYRIEASPTIGSVSFNAGLVDLRRYFFKRPFTFAVRGYHYGRYGGDADNYEQLNPLFVAEETLIRGYGYSGLIDDCNQSANLTGRCPVLERLFGSKVGVFNAEFRIPLFGSPQFGLINFPYLPTELSPFFDAGISWTGDQSPIWAFEKGDDQIPSSCTQQVNARFIAPCARRIPVFSTGISARFNVLGYMILEAYYAHPFQRPGRDWVLGVQMAPGW